MTVLKDATWIFAIISVAFCVSSLGNGANDVANSYATAIASGTLNLKQAGILAVFTEFTGAVVLGGKVTDKIKSGVIDMQHFNNTPKVAVSAMGCVELGTAAWLAIATSFELPVSTTQTVVASLAGVGIASSAPLKWSWAEEGLSLIGTGWLISPVLACIAAMVIQLVLNLTSLNRKDPFKWALNLAPLYIAVTLTLFPIFFLLELLDGRSVEEYGIGRFVGPIVATFIGTLLLSYLLAYPYLHRSLVVQDYRLRLIHIPMGPLLLCQNPPYYFPAKKEESLPVELALRVSETGGNPSVQAPNSDLEAEQPPSAIETTFGLVAGKPDDKPLRSLALLSDTGILEHASSRTAREKYLNPTEDLAFYRPKRVWSWLKYILLRGVSQDCVTFHSREVSKAHEHSRMHDDKVERVFMPLLVIVAVLMSIAHGSNDVANAVGPWVAAYQTWKSGYLNLEDNSPTWIVCIAALLIGAGFWFFGYKVVRSLGNKITHISPMRGFVINMATSITVLLASKFGLPVSTTQCQLGAVIGVGLCSRTTKAINWKQIGLIIMGWFVTLPIAGLISGLLMAMALNAPHL